MTSGTEVTVGSLFSGYGGLDMAVGGKVSWYSEIEPAACKVLNAHYPGVPNLGDITQVDWANVEPVDVITGGYPCQPFSTAGLRAGTNDERHLWPYVRDAISAIRPGLAILENVRGHLSLGLAIVIRDLAAMGYDARWGLVRAADAGAPHNRARVFIVANPSGDLRSYGKFRVNSKTSGAPRVQAPFGGGHSPYAAALAHWESIIGRPAPTPTESGFINPVFIEWMMGLPEGWVTGHGLTLTQSLKMLGNGVCPQQARTALELLAVGND